jgi:hypothetical protein
MLAIGGGALERTPGCPVVGPEQLQPYIVGREVEDQAMILLVDQEAPLAVGQDLGADGHRHPVAAGQDVHAVVRPTYERRRFHGLSFRIDLDERSMPVRGGVEAKHRH